MFDLNKHILMMKVSETSEKLMELTGHKNLNTPKISSPSSKGKTSPSLVLDSNFRNIRRRDEEENAFYFPSQNFISEQHKEITLQKEKEDSTEEKKKVHNGMHCMPEVSISDVASKFLKAKFSQEDVMSKDSDFKDTYENFQSLKNDKIPKKNSDSTHLSLTQNNIHNFSFKNFSAVNTLPLGLEKISEKKIKTSPVMGDTVGGFQKADSKIFEKDVMWEYDMDKTGTFKGLTESDKKQSSQNSNSEDFRLKSIRMGSNTESTETSNFWKGKNLKNDFSSGVSHHEKFDFLGNI